MVERIWSKRVTPTTVEYYVEWQDFPQRTDWTWEPLDHLFGCIEKIAKYEYRAQQILRNWFEGRNVPSVRFTFFITIQYFHI